MLCRLSNNDDVSFETQRYGYLSNHSFKGNSAYSTESKMPRHHRITPAYVLVHERSLGHVFCLVSCYLSANRSSRKALSYTSIRGSKIWGPTYCKKTNSSVHVAYFTQNPERLYSSTKNYQLNIYSSLNVILLDPNYLGSGNCPHYLISYYLTTPTTDAHRITDNTFPSPVCSVLVSDSNSPPKYLSFTKGIGHLSNLSRPP